MYCFVNLTSLLLLCFVSNPKSTPHFHLKDTYSALCSNLSQLPKNCEVLLTTELSQVIVQSLWIQSKPFQGRVWIQVGEYFARL